MRVETEDLVTPKTAASIRGTTAAWIHDLIKRGRLATVEIDGVRFLKKQEVESYQSGEPGRPTQKKAKREK